MDYKNSAFYNLQSKRRLSALLLIPHSISKLKGLSTDSNYIVRKKESRNKYGQIKIRQIEEPKPDLKKIHSRIKDLLNKLDYPSYVHSGQKYLSYKTNAEAHIDNDHVTNIDIASFFPSCTYSSIRDLFVNKFNTSLDIACLIAKLCTTNSHLPTGSPVSQIMALLLTYDMLEEINTLLNPLDILMTVYVDDITLSSNTQINKSTIHQVITVINKYGFKVKAAKLKSFPVANQKEITGVIIHDKKLHAPNKRKRKVIELAKIKNPTEKELRSLFGRISEIQYVEDNKTFSTLKKKIKSAIDKAA